MPTFTPIAAEIAVRRPQLCIHPNALLFTEIEYSHTESNFLAGPFILSNKHYGMASILHFPLAEPEEALTAKLRAEVTAKTNLTYLPFASRKKLEQIFGANSDVFVAEGIDGWFSELDLNYGEKAIASTLRKLEKNKPRAFFFRTAGALSAVLAELTAQEIQAWDIALEEAIFDMELDAERIRPCQERSFSVYLYGNDDCSWATTVATLVEAEKVLEQLQTGGFAAVSRLMIFAN